MKTVIVLALLFISILSAHGTINNQVSDTSTYNATSQTIENAELLEEDTVNNSSPVKEVLDTVARPANNNTSEEKISKQRKDIKPLFTGGLQYYSSQNKTGVLAINLEAGVRIDRKFQHTIDGYWAISRWGSSLYKVNEVWGINYNYLYLIYFGTKFIRLDLGAKAGYNVYIEENKYTSNEYKTVTFGGPKGMVNINLRRIGFGAGYTMYLGYREFNNEKSSTRLDQFSLLFGVRI